MKLEILITIVLLTVFPLVLTQDVIVDTQYGQVRGHKVNVNYTGQSYTVDSFLGIPFGKDTSGDARFRKGEPSDNWTELFVADTLGDCCTQMGPNVYNLHPGWEKFSENCLNLNVYSPDVTGGPYPVLLYVHGGGYQGGCNIAYPGHFMATQGVVVVATNYRLAAFGFSYLGTAASPGNTGMWDQKMALDFIQTNIANFGGNPDAVTVLGLSAGGGSTALLTVSPHTKDLFHKAIMMSGADDNFWNINTAEKNPRQYTENLADKLACLLPDDEPMMDCMRNRTEQEIMDATLRIFRLYTMCEPGSLCLPMVPVEDGSGGFMPQPPSELRQLGDVMTGPIIASIATEDGSGFSLLVYPWLREDCCTKEEFQTALRDYVTVIKSGVLSNSSVEDIYQALLYNYSPWAHLEDTTANRQAMFDFTTDSMFGYQWDKLIKAQSSMAPTYGYIFHYRSAVSDVPAWRGVQHAMDKQYVWSYPLLQFNQEVMNDVMIPELPANYTELDVAYSVFMQELFMNFVKNGNPTPSPVTDPRGNPFTWPGFTVDDMNLLWLDEEGATVIDSWRQENYAFYEQYLPTLDHTLTQNTNHDNE